MEEGSKYYRHSKISEATFYQLIASFARDLSATDTARLTNLTRKTATTIFLKLRRRLAQECKRNSPLTTGKIEINESRSCILCVCGKPSCGSLIGRPIFSILVYDDKVYTEIVPDCRKVPLRAIIRGRFISDASPLADGWRGFHGLVDVGEENPFNVQEQVRGCVAQHVRGVEEFWSFARRRLEKFNGVSNRTFSLHLKECEWRFNLRERDLYSELIALLRNGPI